MTAEERREAKAALVLAGRLQHWRKLMGEGKEERAAEYAKTYKFEEDVAEELAAAKKLATIIATNPDPLAEATAVVEVKNGGTILVQTQGPEIKTINGWPVKSRAEVWRYPLNPRLVVIQLADGRQARMLNSRRRRPLGFKLGVKIEEVAGDDALYVEDFGDE